MQNSKFGFTLIELLVVVLIIGVLAAIALPQYQKAVMRSRFNALMPIAKAMADANEAYYLEHNSYASNPQNLPVEGKTEYPTGTELSFGNDIDYAYVLASNPSVKNNYIVYQKHSANYPGEIHCEAEEGNAQAEYICESAGATQNIGTSITDGYTTYVLSGTGAGIAPGADSGEGCAAATAIGLTCSITTNDEGQTVKQMCKNGFCRTHTYNSDGSYTSVTCQVNSENVCTSNWFFATYDTNGNKVRSQKCNSVDADGNCTAYGLAYNYTYDANGNMLTQAYCNNANSSGNCTAYNGGSNYTYDANGNRLTSRACSSVDSSGNCTAYSIYSNSNYTYDANGNQLTYRACSSVDNSGTCTAYSDGVNYTYDANGNKLTQRQCDGVDNSGNCAAYKSYNSYDYTYDANGNMLISRYCGSLDSSGNCTAYSITYNYTYDANGNMLTERQCDGVDGSGNCTAYLSYNGYDYMYDANGNRTIYRSCNGVDSSGNCTAYSSSSYYTYDDNGRDMSYQKCSGSNINTATGECTAYNNTSVYGN